MVRVKVKVRVRTVDFEKSGVFGNQKGVSILRYLIFIHTSTG
jgi:hypothetical protein